MTDLTKIQMIVDNECPHEVRARILGEFDREPTLWRALALALIEEQQWTTEMKKIVADSSSQRVSLGEESTVQSLVHSDSSEHGIENADRSWKQPNWLPALAASVLLLVGFYGGTHLVNNRSVEPMISTTGGPLVKKSSNSPIDYSAMKMVVTGPNSETAEIPIYDQEDFGRMLARENFEIARANERLRKQGFELDVKPEFYTGKMNDGRQLIVPVKQVGLKPYGL